MEGKLGKIVLCDKNSNPVVIISESDKFLRGLEIVQREEDCAFPDVFTHFILPNNDVVKIKYKGQKLSTPIVDLGKHKLIKNLNIREIAYIKDDKYYKLLKNYVCYYTSLGANHPCYLSVRNDVHEQLIKTLKK